MKLNQYLRIHTLIIASAMCLTLICKLFRKIKTDQNTENLQVSEVINNLNANFNKETVETEYVITDERRATAIRLPALFGTKRQGERSGQKTRIEKEDFATFVNPSLKEYYVVQSLDFARPKTAHMGYFDENRTCKVGVQKRRNDYKQCDMVTSSDSDCETSKAINPEVKSTIIEENGSKNEQLESLLKKTDLVAVNRLNANSKKSGICKDLTSVKIEGNAVKYEHLNVKTYEQERSFDDDSNKRQLEEETIQNYPHKIFENTNTKRKRPVPIEILQDVSLRKYYNRRYTLFSLYDYGIKLDREAWYSATPELIAKHTAHRLSCNIIVDGFCGTGGNSIQFAKTCHKGNRSIVEHKYMVKHTFGNMYHVEDLLLSCHARYFQHVSVVANSADKERKSFQLPPTLMCFTVIAIDIDPVKIEMAKHNARIYGVADKIKFIVGNYVQLAPTIKADVVFLSPPWGGPNYKSNPIYDLEKHLQPLPASSLFTLSQKISGNIAMFLPRKSNTEQLVILAGCGNRVEIEQNFLLGQLIAITAYYGNLIRT